MYEEKNSNFEIVKKIFNESLEKLVFLIFIAHGIAHLVGFFIYWKIMSGTEDVPYKTKIFFSQIEIGTLGISILGFLYFLIALIFIIIGVSLIINKLRFNDNIVFILLIISSVITLIDLMPTIIGLVVNILFLALFLVNKRLNFI